MTPRSLFFVMAAALLSLSAGAQAVLSPGATKRRIICYPPAHDELLWCKRTWRTIDARSGINTPLFGSDSLAGVPALFDLVKKELLAPVPLVTAYCVSMPRPKDRVALTPSEIKELLVRRVSDPPYEQADNPGTFICTSRLVELPAREINQYQLEEDWYFDKVRSVIDVHTLGLCPVQQTVTENGAVKETPLFWIDFPGLLPLLQQATAYNSGGRTFAAIFTIRLFESELNKDSNVYDPTMVHVLDANETLYESKKVKRNVQEHEAALWAGL